MADRTHEYPPTSTDSVRDVLLTPFMVRVREATTGGDSSATLVFRRSRPELIAVAIDEWFNLRTGAEHVISEANSMLHETERIILEDEYGTGNLSFTLRWRDRSVRVAVDRGGLHSGQVVAESKEFRPGQAASSVGVHPGNDAFLEELAVSLVAINRPDIQLEEDDNE
jgi:hypothetical protein